MNGTQSRFVKQGWVTLLLWLMPFGIHALELSIVIKGLESELKENVSAYLSLEQEKGREGLNLSRLRLLHRKAEGEIRSALQPFGYFKPRIVASLRKLDGEAERYEASYEVDAGPAVKLGEVELKTEGEGRDDPLFTPRFPMQPGDLLHQGKYEKAKQGVLTQALEQGYLDARFTRHRLQVDMDRYSATIQLHLNTGRRYVFGDVSFIQDVMDDSLLLRYPSFKAGDPFSHGKLLKLQSDLLDSEYFSHVESRVLRDQAQDERVPVELLLIPNKRDRYRIGLGFSTDIGPRLTFDWRRRRVGSSGHRMLSELRLSGPESSLMGEYIIPLERPAKDALSFGASVQRYDTDSRKGLLALVNAKQSIGLDDGWRRNLGLDYSYEKYEVADQEDAVTLLVPNIQWTKIKSDGLSYSQHGWKLDYRLEGALDQILSSVSYLQLTTHDKFIFGFGGGHWRLLGRTELSATLTDELTELPASKRFFAGGDNSIRGFGLDTLGPSNSDGELVGGRYLAVGSLELERRIFGKWSGAIFFDAGNAFDPDFDSEVEYAAGFGIRWRSPVGPIRLDLANGLSREEPGFRLHVVVGPEL
jgi:translocation and assembly module TamA